MEQISHSDSHILVVDPQKNRIYCTLSGRHLPSPQRFVHECQQASRHVSEGFTVLVDASNFEQMPLLWLEISSRTQKILQTQGMTATAEIVQQPIFEEMAHYKLSKIAGLEKERLFIDILDAESWLDSVSPSHEMGRGDGPT